MIAITVACPAYADLANEQAEHFRRHSKLDTIVVHNNDSSFRHKLDLEQMFRGQKVVFFDADYRLIRDAHFNDIGEQGEFIACHDCGLHDINQFPSPDSAILDINPALYFNSGLWVADFRYESHRHAFAIARQLFEEKRNGLWSGIGDLGEQSFLNAGVQKAGVQIRHLHPRYNFMFHSWRWGAMPEIPREIIGIHAAGTELGDKRNMLNAQHKIFGMSQGGSTMPGVEQWYQQFSKT